jgi:hypothetical protein
MRSFIRPTRGAFFLQFVRRIEGEFVVDRLLLLDHLLVQFGLPTAVRILRIFVVDLLTVAYRARRQWS